MPAKKNVTLKSIAERAGTSVQTASTVLNASRSNTGVSAELRARILAAAEEMQYRRNAIASSLRHGYTNTIGFYTGYGVVSQRNPFIAEILGGIQEGCNQNRKDLLIHGTFRGISVDDIHKELMSGKIDGLVMFAPVNDTLVQRLQASVLPVVAVADMVPGIASVTMEDVSGGRQAARHLYERGHRHILYRQSDDVKVSIQRRLQGLREEADRCGMTVTSVAGLRDPMHGISAIERKLLTSTEADRPTAVVCWCDSAAKVLLHFLLEHDISVPDQIAVVGFDGFDLPYPRGIQLTTMVAAWAEVGRRAVSLLLDDELSDIQKGSVIEFPTYLRVGDTT